MHVSTLSKFLVSLFLFVFDYCNSISGESTSKETEVNIDPNGYLLFCPCMGRFGNQAEHYIGSLGFAKEANRTLILPPFLAGRTIPFSDWFSVSQIAKYHRVITAEDFFKDLAPTIWPVGKRIGFCYSHTDKPCDMKVGNPFKMFWNELGIDFDDIVTHKLGFHKGMGIAWSTKYPASQYPVIALRGAPASFPICEEHVTLQRYFEWSQDIKDRVQEYIKDTFHGKPFVGIHLRNNVDWNSACTSGDGAGSYFMSSYQCLRFDSTKKVEKRFCYPEKETVLDTLPGAVREVGAKYVYVAADKDPMVQEIQDRLTEEGLTDVTVVHHNPALPQVDLATLQEADLFVGNCASSFSAFVSRSRWILARPCWYFGYPDVSPLYTFPLSSLQHEEL